MRLLRLLRLLRSFFRVDADAHRAMVATRAFVNLSADHAGYADLQVMWIMRVVWKPARTTCAHESCASATRDFAAERYAPAGRL